MLLTNRLGIRAIFFDIDGTLISFKNGQLPESALEAILMAKDLGIKVFAATGRHRKSIEGHKALREVHFDGYVTLNGQMCYTSQKIIYQNSIPKEDIRLMAEHAQEVGPCQYITADKVYITQINEKIERLHKRLSMPDMPIIDPWDALDMDVLQMCTYCGRDNFPDVIKNLPNCRFTHWHVDGADIVPNTGNKWRGICHLLKHFKISPGEIAVFGDSDNDVEMLESALYSVAMGQCTDKARAAATIHTTDLEDDGIYRSVLELLA